MKNFLIWGLIFSYGIVMSQNEAFTKEIFVNASNDSLNYRLLVPEKIEKGKKYPLVLFLHGAGERGTDNESQLRNGGSLFTNPLNRETYPSFVLFPQCPTDLYWPTNNRPEQGFLNGNPFAKEFEISIPLKQAAELLEDFISKNPVDESRIYIVGLSMGGMGVLDFVCRFPNRFAAAIAICGAVNNERLEDFSGKTNFRLYHGDIDSVIPVTFSREAYQALRRGGSSVEYIEFYGVNHGSWFPAFNQPDFLSWLYDKKK